MGTRSTQSGTRAGNGPFASPDSLKHHEMAKAESRAFNSWPLGTQLLASGDRAANAAKLRAEPLGRKSSNCCREKAKMEGLRGVISHVAGIPTWGDWRTVSRSTKALWKTAISDKKKLRHTAPTNYMPFNYYYCNSTVDWNGVSSRIIKKDRPQSCHQLTRAQTSTHSPPDPGHVRITTSIVA